jgi:hypothetical protein
MYISLRNRQHNNDTNCSILAILLRKTGVRNCKLRLVSALASTDKSSLVMNMHIQTILDSVFTQFAALILKCRKVEFYVYSIRKIH